MRALQVCVLRSSEEWSPEADLEALTFRRAFGNTADELAAEYGPYGRSFLIGVRPADSAAPIYCMRILHGTRPADLKTLVDLGAPGPWGHVEIDAELCAALSAGALWDIATLSGDPSARTEFGGRGLLALFHGLYRLSGLNDVTHWVAIIDVTVLRLLRGLGLPFRAVHGCAPAPYLGSPASLPVWCSVEEAEYRVAATRPDLAAALQSGSGLELSQPEEWARRL